MTRLTLNERMDKAFLSGRRNGTQLFAAGAKRALK